VTTGARSVRGRPAPPTIGGTGVTVGAVPDGPTPGPDPGSRLPAPPDPATPPDPAAWGAPTAAPARRRGCGCFGTGCLVVLVVLLLVAALGGALALRVPAQLGIWPSGERLLAGTPDRPAAAAILAELKADGIDTTGLSLYVMPVEGQDGTLAYAVLDTSAGFTFPEATTSGRNPIPDMIVRLAEGRAATDAGVAAVAVEYRDPTGTPAGVLVARRAAIADFAAGRIDEAGVSQALHGTFNPAAALTVLGGGQ
jgi:hypothetical protein